MGTIEAAIRKVIDDTNSEMDHYLPAKGETSQECFYRRLTRNMADLFARHRQPDADAMERGAKAIYSSIWFHGNDPAKVPWVDGGNSERQDEARRLCRAALFAVMGGQSDV